MLKSLVLNQEIIDVMCESKDEECKFIHDIGLSQDEWTIVNV